MHTSRGGGTGGRETGRKGAGGVREAGEERAGSGIPKVAGSGRKRGKLRNIAQYFAIEKMQRDQEPKNTGLEPGLKGTGSGRFKPLCPPPPLALPLKTVEWVPTHRVFARSSLGKVVFAFSLNRVTEACHLDHKELKLSKALLAGQLCRSNVKNTQY